MVAKSATTQSDAPLLAYDKFKEEYYRQCRLCSFRLELDEEKRCYRHMNYRPGQFECHAEQWLLPKEMKKIRNKKSNDAKKVRKEAKIARLNSMREDNG